MDRAYIIHEIQRTAKENNGKPLGHTRFATETGIKHTDWFGVYWARWSDAVREAGLTPNTLQAAYEKTFLLDKYAELTRELGRLPAKGDLRLKARTDKTFPNDKTFGSKDEVVRQLLTYCQSRTGFEDVVLLCEAYCVPKSATDEYIPNKVVEGFVYLVKSGRFYKIGRSNATGRRTYELDLQLPEKTKTVHVIRTDDPAGIEAYWHRRFDSKRKNGEWFQLAGEDVAAFKRRKVM